VHLLRWLKIDRFDRRAANRDLAQVVCSAPRRVLWTDGLGDGAILGRKAGSGTHS
jgi:hypothetical protein